MLNDKKYIGKKSSLVEPTKDLGPGRYNSNSTDMDFMDDQKNNPQDYTYEILGVFSNSDLAIEFESWLHLKHNVASNPEYYNKSNQSANGFNTAGVEYDQKRKDEISARSIAYWQDEEFGEERRQHASTTRKEYLHDPNYGEERRMEIGLKSKAAAGKLNNDPVKRAEVSKKQSEAHRGEKSSCHRVVIQRELGTKKFVKRWPYLKLAAKTLGLNPGGLSMAARGDRKSCGDFFWEYETDENRRYNKEKK